MLPQLLRDPLNYHVVVLVVNAPIFSLKHDDVLLYICFHGIPRESSRKQLCCDCVLAKAKTQVAKGSRKIIAKDHVILPKSKRVFYTAQMGDHQPPTRNDVFRFKLLNLTHRGKNSRPCSCSFHWKENFKVRQWRWAVGKHQDREKRRVFEQPVKRASNTCRFIVWSWLLRGDHASSSYSQYWIWWCGNMAWYSLYYHNMSNTWFQCRIVELRMARIEEASLPYDHLVGLRICTERCGKWPDHWLTMRQNSWRHAADWTVSFWASLEVVALHIPSPKVASHRYDWEPHIMLKDWK